MANSHKSCKQCKEFVRVENGIQQPKGFFCSIDHAMQWGKDKAQKDYEKKKAQLDKEYRKETARLKESIKPKKKYLDELQALVNRLVRIRDSKQGCICCSISVNWDGQFHSGHFFPQGRSSAIRFNLWNIHKQASSCNNHLSGNLLEYKPRLIEKIGQERFDYLESRQYEIRSYDIEWIQRAIKIAKKAIKRQKKRI